jgi:DNA-binding NtrC family response regulator
MGSMASFEGLQTSVSSLRALVDELPEGTFVLRVLDGPAAGTTLEIDGSAPTSTLVGKSLSCTLQLTDEAVSRRHCAFDVVGPQLKLTDLGSTNGTWVGDVQIQEARLRGGETIRVGETHLAVERRADGKNPPVGSASSFGRMIGESRAMRRLYPLCARLAAAQIPIVIEGETGTGKEVLVEALHDEGPFASGPFVVFDCTTILPSLFESELFGHEKGAFTGATNLRRGAFEQAHGGTIFLDEIGDCPLDQQAKLLRVIERGEVRRVGGDKWIRCQVRIVAATRRNLDAEVQKGRFRDDLFHRLAVGRIELPPLRARRSDIPLLARHFWKQAGGTGSPPARLLTRWNDEAWPGNVRELRNAVMRVVALGEEGVVAPLADWSTDDESEAASPATSTAPNAVVQSDESTGEDARSTDFFADLIAEDLPLAEARQRAIDELERRYLTRLLARFDGNVTKAAAATGIARRHLQRLRAKARTLPRVTSSPF